MSKGAFPYTGTPLSRAKSGLTKTGRIPATHGTNTGDRYYNVRHTGPTTVGKECRGFKSGLQGVGEAGLVSGSATKHGKQPKGHKSDA